jgi:hypothetical protein
MATVTGAFNTKNCNWLVQKHDLTTMENYSGYLSEGSIEAETNLGDYTVFEDDWTYRLAGKKDYSATLNFVASTGADSMLRWAIEWYENYHDEARRIVMNFPDANVGSERLDGHFMLESLPLNANAGEAGPMMISLGLKGTGEIIHSVVGS